jgi:hypothetical protein
VAGIGLDGASGRARELHGGDDQHDPDQLLVEGARDRQRAADERERHRAEHERRERSPVDVPTPPEPERHEARDHDVQGKGGRARHVGHHAQERHRREIRRRACVTDRRIQHRGDEEHPREHDRVDHRGRG